MRKKWSVIAATLAAMAGLLSFWLVGATNTAHAQTTPATPKTVTIPLATDHSGTATIAAGTTANSTIVTITAKAASKDSFNTTHAGHIHIGPSCTSMGAIQYPLNEITFDATGNGTSTTTIAVAPSAIADGNHYINFHDLSMAAGAGRSLFCGAIGNGATSVALTGASGSAILTDNGDNTTKVQVMVMGLDPDPKNNKHMEHIHLGTCINNGPVVYPLPELVADLTGKATATGNVAAAFSSIADGNHYVNVHIRGMADPGGIGYGITCGTIVAQAVPGTPGTTVAATVAATTAPATVAPTATAVVLPTDNPISATPTASMPGLPNTGNGVTTATAQPVTSVTPVLLLAVALALVLGLGGLLIARGRIARR